MSITLTGSISQTNDWRSRLTNNFGTRTNQRILPNQFLLIDWSGSWLNITEVTRHGASLQLGQSFKNKFNLSEVAGQEAASRWLSELIRERGITTTQAIVAAPRRFVAFKLLALPNVMDNRLAEAVSLQAETLFPVAASQFVVDYIAQPFVAEQAERAVLIAAMPVEQVQRIRSCLSSAGLSTEAILVQELGLANLDASKNIGTHAIVALSPTKIEFIVTSDGTPVLCYAAKTPAVESLANDTLSTLRRLVASMPACAVRDALRMVHVIECPGTHSESLTPHFVKNTLIKTLQNGLNVEVAHRRAPYDELLKAKAIVVAFSCPECRIDFTAPRQPIDHARQRRVQQFKWLAAVAGLVLCVYSAAAMNSQRLGRQIAQLQSQQSQLQDTIAAKQPHWESVSAVTRWQDKQIDYSQAIEGYLAMLPETQDIVLTRLEVAQNTDGQSSIEVEGLARQTQCVHELVDKLVASPDYSKAQLRRLELKNNENRYSADFALSVSLSGGSANAQK